MSLAGSKDNRRIKCLPSEMKNWNNPKQLWLDIRNWKIKGASSLRCSTSTTEKSREKILPRKRGFQVGENNPSFIRKQKKQKQMKDGCLLLEGFKTAEEEIRNKGLEDDALRAELKKLAEEFSQKMMDTKEDTQFVTLTSKIKKLEERRKKLFLQQSGFSQKSDMVKKKLAEEIYNLSNQLCELKNQLAKISK